MHRIDGAGHVGNRFVVEDPATNRPPTEVTADILNALQEEIIAVIDASGIILDKAINNQLLAALNLGYAKLGGLSTQQFSVANASGIHHAMALGQTLGNFSPSGYLQFPFWDGSQLRTGIFQWINVVCTTGGVVQGITLPIAFPNAISQVYGCATGTSQYAFATAWTTLAAVQGSNSQTGGGIAVFAIGY